MSTRVLQPFGEDLRRMAPIWGVVMATAVAVVFSMRFISMNFLTNAVTASQSGCEVADLYVSAGTKRLESLRGAGAQLRAKSPDLSKPSLGILAGRTQLDDARADFRRATELCAINVDAHYGLASVEWYAGNASAGWYHLGMAQRLSRSFESAMVSLQTALAEDPKNMAAQRELALVYRELRRAPDALELVEKGGDDFVATSEGKVAAGMVYSAAGRRDDAERLLREGLPGTPTDIPALRELSGLMMSRGAAREAGDFFASLAEGGQTTTADAWHLASVGYRAANETALEEKVLRRAVSLAPNNPNVIFDLSANLYRQGKKSAARDELRRLLDRDQDFVMRRIQETGVDPRK